MVVDREATGGEDGHFHKLLELFKMEIQTQKRKKIVISTVLILTITSAENEICEST